jgi:DNA-binding HxlR family transcriptional regulator
MEGTRLERLEILFKSLADPARLRILGLLAERPHAGIELAQRLTLTPPTISHHMRRLVDAGLVAVTPQSQSRIYSLQTDVLRDLAQPGERPAFGAQDDTDEQKVLRAFFVGPRLTQIPASRKKRVVVLRKLLEGFSPGVLYREREVNDILRRAHEDVATLRRELVDYGFMVRNGGEYRVADTLPERGLTVSQEVGDEAAWFPALVSAATTRAVRTGS